MNSYVMSEEEKEFLRKYDLSKYDRPSLTADIAVFAILSTGDTDDYRKDPAKRLGVLLIRRGGFPYKDYYALPGGFAAKGEELEETALRELKEETSVDNAFLEPFGVFSAPGRDPRGWVVSQGFLALVDDPAVHDRQRARKDKQDDQDRDQGAQGNAAENGDHHRVRNRVGHDKRRHDDDESGRQNDVE